MYDQFANESREGSSAQMGQATPKRDTLIDKELALFNEETNRLEDNFRVLATRLLSVINQEKRPETSDKVQGDTQETVPVLVDKIRAIRLKIRDVATAISQLESRIEV